MKTLGFTLTESALSDKILHTLRMTKDKGINVFFRLFPSILNVYQKYNVTLNFTKRTKNFVILNSIQNLQNFCVSLYAQVRSSQKIQGLYRFRLGGRNDSDRKELIKKPSPAFVVFANAQTQLLPLTKRESKRNLKELINLSTYKPIYFKFAFTLAEVLITLGIIGVVAAITIPTLIAEHQKRVTVTKLQRAISVINQAYRMSYDDNGDLTAEQINDIGSKAYFDQYWAPYIKVLTYCTNYEMCGYNSNTPFYYVNGSKDPTNLVSNGHRTTFYTADGFLYIIFRIRDGQNISLIMVDINGGSKPNRFGRDVFMLDRIPDGKGVQPYGYNLADIKVDTNCKVETTISNTCAEKIRRAGWKIEKDYPW